VRCECALSRGSSKHSALGTYEGEEERVALVVNLSSSVRRERSPQQPMVVSQDLGVHVAVRPEQLRRSFNVREEERCRR
jgi:hypothetical protein